MGDLIGDFLHVFTDLFLGRRVDGHRILSGVFNGLITSLDDSIFQIKGIRPKWRIDGV
jgi:hypothetical protein